MVDSRGNGFCCLGWIDSFLFYPPIIGLIAMLSLRCCPSIQLDLGGWHSMEAHYRPRTAASFELFERDGSQPGKQDEKKPSAIFILQASMNYGRSS